MAQPSTHLQHADAVKCDSTCSAASQLQPNQTYDHQEFLRIRVVHYEIDGRENVVFAFTIREPDKDGILSQPKPTFFRELGEHFDSHLKPGRQLEINVQEYEDSASLANYSLLMSNLVDPTAEEEQVTATGFICVSHQVTLGLTPIGCVTLKVQHLKRITGKRKVQRQGALKKPKFFDLNGHHLVLKFFGGLTFCSYCTDFLWGFNKQGYECERCHIALHNKCHSKFINVCSGIAETPSIILTDDKGKTVTLNRPHQFKQKNFNRPVFCLHCGQFLWGLYNQGLKCTKCKQACHYKCAGKVANSCGINLKQLEKDYKDKSSSIFSSSGSTVSEDNLSPFVYEDPVLFKPKREPENASVIKTVRKPDRLKLEDFQLLKLIGHGSYGKVFSARWKYSDDPEKLFAVKAMNIELIFSQNDFEITRIERTVAQIATKEQAPFLVHILGTFRTQTHFFYVFDLLPGGDLMYHLRRLNLFGIEQTRFYAAEIACALEYLHSKHIVFRDLKLDNVLLDSEGHVRLCDYGLCKDKISEDCKATTFCGTLAYLAPEIIQQQQYSFSVDWWSFGVVVFEMATGYVPFFGITEAELFQEILDPDLPDFNDITDTGCRSVLKALFDRDPEKRLGSSSPVRNHPFFTQFVDWNRLERREATPPYVPRKDYVRNFDGDFIRSDVHLSSCRKFENLMATIPKNFFNNFSFINSRN